MVLHKNELPFLDVIVMPQVEHVLDRRLVLPYG